MPNRITVLKKNNFGGNKSIMKYALIGCGRIATNHMKAAVNNKLEIAAVCDVLPEKMEELLAKHDLQNDDSIKRYEDYKKMIEEIKQPERIEGTIRLAMSSSVCSRYFVDDFLRFREQFPDVCLIVSENVPGNMFDMLQKNEVDLVFTLDSHIYNSEYIICAEREESVHFITATDHPIQHHDNILLNTLRLEEFVLTESDMSYCKLLNQELAAQSIEIRPVLEIGNPLQICDIVQNSRLISFLPDFIFQDHVESGSLKTLDVDDCSVKVWTQLLIHRNKWRSPALEAFIDFYKKVMQR